ncbi:uncharacterized protein BP5553_09368 [Venustampulla echinocandica]|uniref:Uncharacterized protein n=1 Tax=Venustampulla echinocandica TaxID=2656787 RepID=A0A370TCK7_9HELO|nr:uncharacterized protein BP5553_09368 [Venustampulla echinocandica]RDL31966.1 hypothetical protein BP5553_09368 [Venustampulla echinocandica]
MEAAIGAGIETIKAINIIIGDLRSTPAIVQRIMSKSAQLRGLLEALQRKSQTQILSDAGTKGWLEQQHHCNRTLRRIEDILEEYAKGSTAKVPILSAITFEFGPKGELIEHMKDLEDSVKNFIWHSKIVQPGPKAGFMEPPQRRDNLPSRNQAPAMSLSQFVQKQTGSL